MNRRQRRSVNKSARKEYESVQARKNRLKSKLNDPFEQVSVLKTWLWGYLIYVKEGYSIAPIRMITFFSFSMRWDGLSVMFLWKMRRFICIGFRQMRNRKEKFKIGKLLIYIK